MKRRILNSMFIILIIGSSVTLAQTLQNPTIIVPDYQVNDNGGPGIGTWQVFPAIASNNSGQSVIAWEDGRNEGTAIYAQRFDGDGDVIGPNIEVWELGSISNDVRWIAVAINENNDFVITWAGTYDRSNIYAKCFTSDGNARADVFTVNNEPYGSPWNGNHSISMNAKGGFVVTWEGAGIIAQRYSSDGIPQGPNFIVNEVKQDISAGYPFISMTDNGDFVITWRETKYISDSGGYNQSDIYAQRFHSDGNRAGTHFKVNNDGEMDEALSPSAFMTEEGNFTITWLKPYEESGYDIYAQRFASDGSVIGSNFKFKVRLPYIITDRSSFAFYPSPSIASNDNGTFLISWLHGDADSGYDVNAQCFFSDGSPKGENFKVNDGPKIRWRTNISTSSDSTGNLFITWTDSRNRHADIYAQRYDGDGSFLGDNFKVNDDLGRSIQSSAAISTDISGNFVIAWGDGRNGDFDIYARRFAMDGSPLGDDFRVNDDQGKIRQGSPDISIDNNGNFVVVWLDYRNGDENVTIHYDRNPDVYAQRYANDGTALGDNFRVNDDLGSMYQRSPAIASDYDGNFVITWTDHRNNLDTLNYVVDVYAQLYSSDGEPVSTNYKVNDDQHDNELLLNRVHAHPSVSMDGNGNFIIIWDERIWGDNSAIYAQRYSKDGSLIENNFRVNLNGWTPHISSDVNGNFVITWRGGSINSIGDIIAKQFAADGSATGEYFRVSDARVRWGDSFSISSDNSGNFIITWAEQHDDDWDVYGQRYSTDGSVVGSKFRMTNTSENMQHEPVVALFNGRIYSAWTDNRAGGTANDIWANVLDWGSPTAVDDKEQSQTPSEFTLHQNYPNPFNPTTTIEYALPKVDHVTIQIYDVLGRHIKTLVNCKQNAGRYQTVWNGTDENHMQVAAGVYFYKMEPGEYVKMNKLVLVK